MAQSPFAVDNIRVANAMVIGSATIGASGANIVLPAGTQIQGGGAFGATGATGVAGTPGSTGATGVSGTPGTPGSTGATGPAGAAAAGGMTWQAVQAANFLATAGNAYPVNTSSGAVTVTLPASAALGNTVKLVDYAGTFDTNAITINPNGLKLRGSATNAALSTRFSSLELVYMDST
ncbi:MAG: hypothetical protein EB072_15210, partial [Betaproteobacteria bacterium]|nr:hypothetical protein [Betaproteobacteria bacterium]